MYCCTFKNQPLGSVLRKRSYSEKKVFLQSNQIGVRNPFMLGGNKRSYILKKKQKATSLLTYV